MEGGILVALVVIAMAYVIWRGHVNAKVEAKEKAEAEKAEATFNEKKDDSVA